MLPDKSSNSLLAL